MPDDQFPVSTAEERFWNLDNNQGDFGNEGKGKGKGRGRGKGKGKGKGEGWGKGKGRGKGKGEGKDEAHPGFNGEVEGHRKGRGKGPSHGKGKGFHDGYFAEPAADLRLPQYNEEPRTAPADGEAPRGEKESGERRRRRGRGKGKSRKGEAGAELGEGAEVGPSTSLLIQDGEKENYVFKPRDRSSRLGPAGKGKGRNPVLAEKGNGKGKGCAEGCRGRIAAFPRGVPASESSGLVGKLSTQLWKEQYDCMICMVKIKKSAEVWTCENCWAVFHMNCLHQWICRSNPEKGPKRPWEWRCPGCQFIYVSHKQALPTPTCFCGSQAGPPPSFDCPPHTCGQPCGRKRDCGHPCVLDCHPGPCPPCLRSTGDVSCFCGAATKEAICGEGKGPWSCGKICSKQLGCGKEDHLCQLPCHAGPCQSCPVKVSDVACHCGKRQEERPCGQESFSCKEVCQKELSCGHHSCTEICHSGECDPLCPLDPEKTGTLCSCGKTDMKVERQSCTDPVLTCDRICGKTLNCGHQCSMTCHAGPCGDCQVEVPRLCRCGKQRRKVLCSAGNTEFNCGQPCRTRKSCGRHKCEEICCPGGTKSHVDEHICIRVCGRKLNCGRHTCDDMCHLGKCRPCAVVFREPLTCSCGRSVVSPPVPCGTPSPECPYPCGKTLPCGHECLDNCHPGECTMCTVLVSKVCQGGHREMHNIPCHRQKLSCGDPCRRLLSCGRHHCPETCHPVDGDNGCKPCASKCGARGAFCSHPCPLPCHDGPCPDVPCEGKVVVSCKCGLRLEEQKCGAYSEDPSPERTSLSCNEACLKTKRAAELRSAFGGVPKLSDAEDVYSGELFEAGQALGEGFLRVAEQKLIQCSSSRAALIKLPPCPSPEARWVLFEYARWHFRLKVESTDDVLAVRFQSGGRIPSPLLSVLALEMAPSQALKFTFEFTLDCPRLRIYSLNSVDWSGLTKHISEVLAPFVGKFHLRKWKEGAEGGPQADELYIEFMEKATCLEAERKIEKYVAPSPLKNFVLENVLRSKMRLLSPARSKESSGEVKEAKTES